MASGFRLEVVDLFATVSTIAQVSVIRAPDLVRLVSAHEHLALRGEPCAASPARRARRGSEQDDYA